MSSFDFVGQIPGSPETEVSPGVFKIWVAGVGSSKAPWYPCATVAWRTRGRPGYSNTYEGAWERLCWPIKGTREGV